ncbi:MAG: DNA-directed RNA polymerase subunit omega [Candidatus Eisenbacteria bacterium]
MNHDRPESTFSVVFPEEENIYELVVVAALRARQLNDFPRLRDRERPGPIVDQAMREAASENLEYRIADKEEDGARE